MEDQKVLVGDYEIGVEINSYHDIPPSGRCAAMCETPEEFYGDYELEYQVVRIYNEDEDTLVEGEDLDAPEGITDGQIYESVAEAIRKGNE